LYIIISFGAELFEALDATYVLPKVSNNLLLWFDANDASTLNTSGALTQWKDKSGNNATAAPQLGSCSYNATGFNGKPSVNFNNSALKVPLKKGTFPSGSGISVLTAYYTTNGGGWGVPFTRSINNVADPIDLYNASRWTGNAGAYSAYGSSIDLRNLNTPCIYDITVNAQGWNEWVNGGAQNWSTSFNVPFSDTGSDQFFLGGRWDNVTYLNGFISETIVYSGILSTADRQTLEGYLAWKWGIQNTLPSNHPYKAAAPPSSIAASNTSSTPGLIWTAYDGYHNENPAFSLNQLKGDQGASTGTITDFTNLTTATQNNFPANTGSHHNFTVVWTGYLFTQNFGGSWHFHFASDDGSYMWIGDAAKSGYTVSNVFINNGNPHGMADRAGDINLTANTYYPVRLMFGEIGGGYDMQLRFTPPGQGETANGNGFFFTAPPPPPPPPSSAAPGLIWTAYDGYHNENPAFSLNQLKGDQGASTGTITDFTNLTTATQNNFPANTGTHHNFTVVWTGYLFTQNFGGSWHFHFASDDGSYMWIGDAAKSGYTVGNVFINNGNPHGMADRAGDINLTANTYYPIRLMFGEIGGGYDMQLRFTPPVKEKQPMVTDSFLLLLHHRHLLLPRQ
jgi:hypothetical protein